MELITPLDMADEIRTFLTSHLPGVQVTAGTTPTKFQTESVHIVRTGGQPRDLVSDTAVLSIDCRHLSSEVGADRLARNVYALMTAAERIGEAGGATVYESTPLTGPYDNPDPTHPSLYRVTCTYQVAARMAASETN